MAAPASLSLQTSPGEKQASVSLILSTPKFQGRHLNFSQELHHSTLLDPKETLGGLKKSQALAVLLNPLLEFLVSS